MKKIAFLSLLLGALLFTSCSEEPNYKAVTTETPIPLGVSNSLEDSSFIFDHKVLEDKDNFYVVEKKEDRKVFTKIIKKNHLEEIAFIIG